jgi:head-tail adaptor
MSMDRYITLQRETLTLDASGGSVSTWATLTNFHAAKYDKAVKEMTEDGREFGVTYTMWKVRYDGNNIPVAGDRVLEGTSYYQIEGVKEIGRKHFLELKTMLKV